MSITIASFLDIYDAHLLRSRLEFEEIEVKLYDEFYNTYLPIHPIILGGYKLIVPLSQKDKALEVIDFYYKSRKASTSHCYNCDSTELKKDYKKHLVFVCLNLFSVLTLVGYSLTNSTYRYKVCKVCHYTF